MAEWRDLSEAPQGIPVKVWASYDPQSSLMSWREFIAIRKWGNWWQTYGKRGLRVFPTHWKPLDQPEQD